MWLSSDIVFRCGPHWAAAGGADRETKRGGAS